MTPSSREAMEKAWSERRDLKYDPLSLDEIAEGEYKGGWQAAAEFYEGKAEEPLSRDFDISLMALTQSAAMKQISLDKGKTWHVELHEAQALAVSVGTKAFNKGFVLAMSPPAQESPEVRELVDSVRDWIKQGSLFPPHPIIRTEQRVINALAAYDAKKGKP